MSAVTSIPDLAMRDAVIGEERSLGDLDLRVPILHRGASLRSLT